jgi:hypothetical protein
MARFVLQPCKLREDRLVPIKGAENEEVTWRELVVKLAPSADIKALRTLYYIQQGAFIGLLQHPKNPNKEVNFCFVAQDRSGSVAAILRRDPSFAKRLTKVYSVISADRGAQLAEQGEDNFLPISRGVIE